MSNTQSNPSLARLDPSNMHTFIVPSKKINEGRDVSTFQTSRAYVDIMTFVMQLNRAMFPIAVDSYPQRFDAVAQSMPPDESLFSATVHRLQSLLDELEDLVQSNPPDLGPRRFGNVSFRNWYQVVESRAPTLLRTYVAGDTISIRNESEITPYAELESYLLGSFGSAQRLDYGTGHELSFLAFLGCIWKLGGFQSQDSHLEQQNIVLGIIGPYLRLVRKLIKTYTLEPAGSHGVWGLDDHSFLPYIFGSAQYGPAVTQTDPTPTEGSHPSAPSPADVTKAFSVERLRKTSMYFDAIGFIHDVKTGPFWEHSPTLYDISGVKGGWGKINKGMIKMYNAEVLSKFPVVQHFRFGSLFSWNLDPSTQPPPSSAHASSQPDSRLPSNTESPSALTNTRSPLLIASPVEQFPGHHNTPAQGINASFNGLTPAAAPCARTVHTASCRPQLDKSSNRRQLLLVGAQKRTVALPNPSVDVGQTSAGALTEPMVASEMPPPTKAPWSK